MEHIYKIINYADNKKHSYVTPVIEWKNVKAKVKKLLEISPCVDVLVYTPDKDFKLTSRRTYYRGDLK